MKLSVRMYRVAKVDMDHLRAAAGLSGYENANEDNKLDDLVMRGLVKAFGPLAIGLKIFCPERPSVLDPEGARHFGLVGMEMMGFDLPHAETAVSGIVRADPIDEKDMDRLDGALLSELSRWGIYVEPSWLDTRMAYSKDGN